MAAGRVVVYAILVAVHVTALHIIRSNFERVFTKCRFHMSTTASDRQSAQQTLSYDLNAFENTYSSCSNEICQVISESIPADIEGTYFKNGYGNFEVGKELVMHPFDTDGMIAAITFKDGKAIFRNRIIGTKGYIKEKKTKKISFRGTFGTQKKGGFLANMFDTNLKNTANTNVVYWGNQLLALWEGGLPHRMEADSLRTYGESRIKGLLKPKQPFSAHPKIDPHTNRLVSFSVEQKGKTSLVTVFEFDDKFDVARNRSFEIPGFCFFHDFVVTKNHYLFGQAPTSFDPLPFILGLKTPGECIAYDSLRPVKMFVVPRVADGEVTDKTRIQVVDLPTHFNFHYANGFEDSKGNIIVDTIKCDKMTLSVPSGASTATPVWIDLDYAKTVPYCKLTRYTLSQSSAGEWACSSTENLSETHMDFPVLNPSVMCKQNRYIFGVCGTSVVQTTPFQGIVKLDLLARSESQWLPERHEFLAEPMFIPRKNNNSSNSNVSNNGSTGRMEEDDGYIAAYLCNGRDKTSDFLLFDAKDISKGPILRVPLPVYMPVGLHGSYTNGLVFDPEDIARKFKVNKALDSKRWNEMKGGFSGLGLSYDMYD